MVRSGTAPLRMHTRAKELKRNFNPYSGLLKNFDVCPTHHPQQHSSNTSIFLNTPQQLKDCEANSQTVPQLPGSAAAPSTQASLHSSLGFNFSPPSPSTRIYLTKETQHKKQDSLPLSSHLLSSVGSVCFSYFHTTECPGTMRAD